MIYRTLLILTAFALPASLAAKEASSGSANAQDSRTVSTGGLKLTLPDGVSESDLGDRDVRVLAVQVMLDRSRHSPGVMDGYMGGNTRRAIRYYRMANGLPEGDSIDEELVSSLLDSQGGDVFRTYTITEDDVAGPFRQIPSDFRRMAELDALGYSSPREKLAERFHMDERFLSAINPGADFSRAGTEINIVSHGDDEIEGSVERIEVRKRENTVAALDAEGRLLASYPATIGSDIFPTPEGSMKVEAVAPEPVYYFDPEGREWGPDERLEVAAGPNNPVGGTWIDLEKEGYGIHGSPDPSKVAKRASHGCVRLTNWDAEELAGAVSAGVPVEFV